MKKFEIGKTYTAESLFDSNCVFSLLVISRTAKTLTIKFDEGFTKRCKVYEHKEAEACYALGTYSMEPCFSA